MDNDGDRKTFEVMTSAETLVTIGSSAVSIRKTSKDV
jgi:hypothetical protein